MPPSDTAIKIRVQARGGKILGPAVTAPRLTVRNAVTGEVLYDQPMNNGSSGTVEPQAQFSGDISREIVIVQPTVDSPTPGPYWLLPDANEGQAIARFRLTQPALLVFTATAYAPEPVTASATMYMTPGMQLLEEPGLVLTIAGLSVTATVTAKNGTANVTATVRMMCGCPITPRPIPPPPPGQSPPEPYWPYTEFQVSAQLRGNGGFSVYAFDLACTDTDTFTGSTQVPSGEYEVWITAVQPKETNVGFYRMFVVVD